MEPSYSCQLEFAARCSINTERANLSTYAFKFVDPGGSRIGSIRSRVSAARKVQLGREDAVAIV